MGATIGALVLWRRRGSVPAWPGRLQVGGGVALLFTGVAHCALAPSHFEEGWHLGAFFVASGLVLLGQAVLVCVKPSRAAYRSVVVSTVVMIALYVLARQLTLPLVDHRDPYLLEDLPVKIAEVVAAGVAVAGLVALRRRAQPVRSETFGSAGAMSMAARPVPLPIGYSPSIVPQDGLALLADHVDAGGEGDQVGVRERGDGLLVGLGHQVLQAHDEGGRGQDVGHPGHRLVDRRTELLLRRLDRRPAGGREDLVPRGQGLVVVAGGGDEERAERRGHGRTQLAARGQQLRTAT